MNEHDSHIEPEQPETPAPIPPTPVPPRTEWAYTSETRTPPPLMPARTKYRLLGWPVHPLETLGLITLVAYADLCTFVAYGGAGSACLIALALGAVLLRWRKGIDLASGLIALAILLVAIAMAWHHWWLQPVAAWAALFVLGVRLRTKSTPLADACWLAWSTILVSCMRLYGHWVSVWRRARIARRGDRPSRTINTTAIVTPILVCAAFIGIFSAANPILSKLFRHTANAMNDHLLDLMENIDAGRVAIWFLWAAVFAGLLRCADTSAFTRWLSRYSDELKEGDILSTGRNAFTSALSTLVSVNLLFLAYNAFDAFYLYFKATLPDGITWTDYTHAGCGWLTFGLFLSTVIIGSVFWGDLTFHPRARTLKQLAFVWVAQNVVLGIGTTRRIQLYIDYSGLTHLRLVGIYGAALVVVGLGFMTYKVYANRSAIWLIRRDIGAFLTAICLLAITPHDILCASYNAARIQESKPRALRPVFLKTLSPGALPSLVPLLGYTRPDGNESKEQAVRRGVAALLGEGLERARAQRSADWQAWQGSRSYAIERLEPHRDRIHATCASHEWAAARQTILNDYDLTWIGHR